MFPRRRNILLAVSKSATAAFSLPFLHFPLHLVAFTFPKFAYDDKVQSTLGSTLFAKREEERTLVYTCESLWSRKIKFMQIRHAWIILYRPYFLNGLICSSQYNGEDGNKIHGGPKCVRNIFLSISERFLSLTSPFASLPLDTSNSPSVRRKYKRWIGKSATTISSPIRRVHISPHIYSIVLVYTQRENVLFSYTLIMF